MNLIPGNKKNSIFNIIKSQYGLRALQLLRSLVSQGNRIARHKGHLFFNHSCLREDYLPQSLRFKPPINTAAGRSLTRKFGFSFVKLRINESHHWIRISLDKIDNIKNELQSIIMVSDYNYLIEWFNDKQNRQLNNLMDHHKSKLHKLLRVIDDKGTNDKQQNNWVINLSKQELSKAEQAVLNRGLNFAVTPKTTKNQDIIAEVEKGIRKLPHSAANIIRSKVVNILNQPNSRQSNLTIEETKALKTLANRDDLVITRADKGNCTVVLDKSDYEEKIYSMLNDNTTYSLLKRDLTGNIERKLNKYVYQLFKNKSISQSDYFHLRSSDAIAPMIYGLPKIHKPNAPLRPIVSFINSPLYNLSKFLTNILSPLIGKNDCTVKNSYDFVDSISKLKIGNDECLASFDVISLFTKIPVDLTKSIIIKLLKSDNCLHERTNLTFEEVVEGINLCLNNTYIQFRGKFYKQIFGVPMGSPISVTIANLVMETVENTALQTFSNQPIIWKRYVDDTFVIIKRNKVEAFHQHINSIETSIKFTLELECNNSLPFLDVLVVREKNGKLTTKLFQKPTHTNRFLNFNSQHSTYQKQGLVQTMMKRINSKLVTKKKDRIIESKKLMEALRKNDYPDWFIKQTVKRMKGRSSKSHINSKDLEKKGTVVLPYIKNQTEKITRILKGFNIQVYTRPAKTIKTILSSSKDKIVPERRTGAIYQIPCKNCSAIYIGETGRNFKTRCSEHKRDLYPKNIAKIDDNNINKKTALVKHVINSEHCINWNGYSILHYESDFFKRRFLESYYIHRNNSTMNDKEGCCYNEIYDNLK